MPRRLSRASVVHVFVPVRRFLCCCGEAALLVHLDIGCLGNLGPSRDVG